MALPIFFCWKNCPKQVIITLTPGFVSFARFSALIQTTRRKWGKNPGADPTTSNYNATGSLLRFFEKILSSLKNALAYYSASVVVVN
jgi:hypothetical protein